MKIAFIGLGNMGLPMAKNLIKANFEVIGFDINTKAMDELQLSGGQTANTIAKAVAQVDVVITMLPASQQVENSYLATEGILNSVQPNTLLIDCSTIAPESAKKVADQANQRGFQMLDAPVSGGTAGAINGTLTFMVGGSKEILDQCMPLFQRMGKNIYHAGPNGCGQTVKVCNNMLLGILMLGTSEALKLGVANGMDPKILSEIMSKSSGRNWALEVYNPCPNVMDNTPASNQYKGGFGVDLMLKDLGLATENAMSVGASIPLGELARNMFNLHSKSGNGKLDFSSIFNLLP